MKNNRESYNYFPPALFGSAAITSAAVFLMLSVCLCESACRGEVEKRLPRAARSIHLRYPAEQGVVYYNEVTVQKSYLGSYFCVCGFGHYSFVEDFMRRGESAHNVRRALYGNGWVKSKDGKWLPLTQATFTADRTPIMNIDAGVENGRFYLQNGGDTQNNTPLRSKMNCRVEQMSRPEASFDDKWELLWSDEFNYEDLADESKWNYHKGFAYNREKQYYTKARAENARVEDGSLIIESRKEKYEKGQYTSARLHTRNKAQWL